MKEQIKEYLAARMEEFDLISNERKQKLTKLSQYIQEQFNKQQTTNAIVICTHNSRRSHLGQLWLLAAAYWKGITNIATYSGGTEGTAVHPNTIAALQRAGFDITTTETTSNPNYQAKLGEALPAQTLFSKKYNHAANPQKDFAAIMVCTDADEACPIVFGAAARISLPFEDPKVADGTPQEAEQYDECSRQIAREMLFAVSEVNLGN